MAMMNEKQKEAIRHMQGPALVIAGAGSGKTRVLTHRVAYLISKGVKPENILLLTFTRRAAKEMISRATALLDDRCKKIEGGTFHSFANKILKKYHDRIGFDKNFIILTPSNSYTVIEALRYKYHPERIIDDVKFPQKNVLQKIFSKAINTNTEIKLLLKSEYDYLVPYTKNIEKIYKEFLKEKQKQNLIDYDDFLTLFCKLLKDNKDIRKKLSNQYKYIMVDEFQDVNYHQTRMIKLLASEHNNVMVVGDDSQSIYGFRGSNYKNILEFPKIFKNTKKIFLERNYRSTPQILEVANSIIKTMKYKYDKNLYTENKWGNKPELFQVNSIYEQNEIVTNKILALRKNNVSLNEIAVLSRSAFQTNELELLLRSNKIPYVKWGGFSFLESAHIRDFISLLSICINIKDIISWQNVLRLFHGVGYKTSTDIAIKITESGKYKTLLIKNKSYSKELKKLYDLIVKVNELQTTESKVLEAIKYYDQYLQEHEDYDRKRYDINTFINLSKRYKSLQKLINDLLLDASSEVDKKEKGKVILSTIHSVKGLEFDYVFIVNISDGGFPSNYSLSDEEQLEEEKRLFYVAVTRAKKGLYLFSPLTNEEHEELSLYNERKKEFSSILLREIKDPEKVFKIHNYITFNTIKWNYQKREASDVAG